jgi:hypothetical protein
VLGGTRGDDPVGGLSAGPINGYPGSPFMMIALHQNASTTLEIRAEIAYGAGQRSPSS